MCIKFCGTFESHNPGIYVGLVNFTAEIDALLAVHMKGLQVFKGISKTQNELLDAMLEIYKQNISTCSFYSLLRSSVQFNYYSTSGTVQ
nr:unnamed protein product [Callosobruchus analis]